MKTGKECTVTGFFLRGLIDYAGLYPPAGLAMEEVLANYERYLASPEGWILNRLVLPKLPALKPHWRITLLVESEPGPLPPQVETLETKSARRLSLPTYCEAPLDQITDGFAKVRTGGLTPDAIPSSETIADFLHRAAARRIPFKATAGLHHALTYAPDSPRAAMHGFVNVFAAAAFAWHGVDRATLVDVLNAPGGFEVDDEGLHWRDHALTAEQIVAARRDFAHSFGSCSFEEPVADLRALGWIA